MSDPSAIRTLTVDGCRGLDAIALWINERLAPVSNKATRILSSIRSRILGAECIKGPCCATKLKEVSLGLSKKGWLYGKLVPNGP